MCANDRHPLIGDNSPTSWPYADYVKFVNAIVIISNKWKWLFRVLQEPFCTCFDRCTVSLPQLPVKENASQFRIRIWSAKLISSGHNFERRLQSPSVLHRCTTMMQR